MALLAIGCSRQGGGDVLLISVDTLRADRIGLNGYARSTTPHIDRWFADAATYERAYATAAMTSPSVVSMLTGLLPQEHGVRLLYQILPAHVPVLPVMLPERWQTAAFVSNLVLTDEAIGLAPYFDHYDDYVAQRESRRNVFERNAADTTDAVLRWLATERDPERRAFIWVHYIDPHGPYQPPADWPRVLHGTPSRAIDVERVPEYQRAAGVTDGQEYIDRYDEEVRYLDSQVDRLLAHFAARDELDAALVILTADHGESMMEHEQWFTHSYHVYDEIARIPLLLRGPGVAPGRRAQVASLVEIAPTILAFAGSEPPPRLARVDLRDGRGLTPDHVAFTEAADAQQQWRAAIQGTRKWMLSVPKQPSVQPERRFYDLATDPGELAPAPWPATDGAAALLVARTADDPDPAGVPRRYRAGRELSSPKVAPGLAPETLERLRALGYVDADEAGSEAPGPASPATKSKTP